MVNWGFIMIGDRSITVEEMRQYVRENYGKELGAPDRIWLKDGMILVKSMTHPDTYHIVQNGKCTCPTWIFYEKYGKGWCGHL